jgi:hypothetical protein
LYTSQNIIRAINSRRIICAVHVARMGDMRNAYKILVGKPERKRTLRKRKARWEDNIITDLREKGWETVDWTHLT